MDLSEMDESHQSAMAMSFDPNKIERAASAPNEASPAKPSEMKKRASRGSEADLGALLTTTKYRDGATVAEVGTNTLSAATVHINSLCLDPEHVLHSDRSKGRGMQTVRETW